jgi:hypothetical protein
MQICIYAPAITAIITAGLVQFKPTYLRLSKSPLATAASLHSPHSARLKHLYVCDHSLQVIMAQCSFKQNIWPHTGSVAPSLNSTSSQHELRCASYPIPPPIHCSADGNCPVCCLARKERLGKTARLPSHPVNCLPANMATLASGRQANGGRQAVAESKLPHGHLSFSWHSLC